MAQKQQEYASKEDVDRLSGLIEELAGKINVQSASQEDNAETDVPEHKVIDKITEQVTAYVKAHPVRATVLAFLLGFILASRGRR